MINIYQLTDAVPAALFGMFALWAAGSKWHWFVRTAVVAGALLLMLLIPAYEVVIEFSIEVLLVVAGLAIWKRWRRATPPPAITAPSSHLPQWSLSTLMLLMIVVAVATTVAARAPSISFDLWLELITVGVITASVGLASVWVVCGRARWWVRLLAAPLIAALIAAAKETSGGATSYLRYRMQSPAAASQFLQEYFSARIWSGISYWLHSVAIGMAIIVAWLYLARRAGWFDPFDELDSSRLSTSQLQRATVAARWGTVILFGLVSLFPLALLYELMTPTPIPTVNLPKPNGFDDFVAAGRMIAPADVVMLRQADALSDATLRALLANQSASFDRVGQGLQKACWNPHGYASSTSQEEQSLIPLMGAMAARGALAERDGAADQQLAAYWDMLRVSIEADRGTGATYSIPAQFEPVAVHGLWNCRKDLTAQQCVALAADLWKLESSREPWQARAQRQRIINENVNWEWHLSEILRDWSSGDRYEWEQQALWRRMTELRMLIVGLAIRAHQFETGKAPATLASLVPKYMPVVPDDPHGSGAIKYRISGNDYLLYSAGEDGDDDNGVRPTSNPGIPDGDMTVLDLFPPIEPPSSPDTSQSPDAATGQGSADAPAENLPREP